MALSKTEYLNAKKKIYEDYKVKRSEKRVEELTIDLVRLSKLLFSLYNRLYHLEIDGKQDTPKFDAELRGLYNIVKTEDTHYKDLLAIDNLLVYVRLYINQALNKGIAMDVFQFEEEMNEIDVYKIINRTLLTLDEKITNQLLLQYKIKGEPIDDDFKSELIDNYVSSEIAKNHFTMLQDGIDDRLNYIGEELKLDGVNHCIKKLLRTKYEIAFTYLDIESYMIKSKFYINSSTFSNFSNVLPFNIEDDYNDKIKRKAIMSIAEEIINDVLGYSDNFLIDIDNKVLLISEYYNLKATLLLLDEEDIGDLYASYSFTMKIKKNAAGKSHNISKRMLIDAFEQVKLDKEKYLFQDAEKVKK